MKQERNEMVGTMRKPNQVKFLEVGPELGNNYTEVIAPQDVATYGGLCALAKLVPEIRELIHDFYTSHYASCLEYLGNLKANLMLDIHLHDHVETLYDQIRSKALIQYTHPFVSVDLNMMANAFKTSVAGLEKELEALITDNQIQVMDGLAVPVCCSNRLSQQNFVCTACRSEKCNLPEGVADRQGIRSGCEINAFESKPSQA
ncbi:COP9 signalosome complex subunit 1 [Capsicum annuum]|nr:COP9 signalosome complex subunit 1 [Capsicum annuum]